MLLGRWHVDHLKAGRDIQTLNTLYYILYTINIEFHVTVSNHLQNWRKNDADDDERYE